MSNVGNATNYTAFWRDIAIERRDLHFDLASVDFGNWHSAGPQVSHYLNVQSCLFPQGERFFIRSVRRFAEQIDDPALRNQIRGFIGQEAMHGREHEAYNEALTAIGYKVAEVESLLKTSFARVERHASPLTCLALTVAMEHITAISAESVLADPRAYEGSDPKMAELWLWHAAEETEHKAVAFDVYQSVCGKGFRSWLRRCVALIFASITMRITIWFGLLRVLARHKQLFNLRGWWRYLRFGWVQPGYRRGELWRWLSYFRPSFHPWNHDNRDDLQRWLQRQ